MNLQQFVKLLEGLTQQQWQDVLDGQAVLLVDDQLLEIGNAQSANAIIKAIGEAGETVDQLTQLSIAQAADLLQNYYLTHPLTLKGFNSQVKALFEQHGMKSFAAAAEQVPAYTLFVEAGEVMAESRQSPRHRYGVYCELASALSEEQVSQFIQQWLERGEAYDNYLGMNVCRYNC